MKLHIGGTETSPDWKILDVYERPEVDFVGNASDLSQFADESIDAIYASHVLEHFFYGLGYELSLTLLEWYRVLKVGGQLMISVPDLRTLAWLYSRPNLDVQTRIHIMRMIFGGQTNEYDVHKVGFDFDILWMYLSDVGFSKCEQVEQFNLFNDCSKIQLMGTWISLNVIATK
jgi:predicted SAM-dependent methyltransferase